MRQFKLIMCATAWLTALPFAIAADAQTDDATMPVVMPGEVSNLHLQVNLPARELRVIEHDTIVATYPVAIGAVGFKSPLLQESLTQLIWNPSWIPTPSPWAAGAKTAPPGPNNPLGPVKMPLSGGYRVHGTNKPNSIGRAASHGCFRMHNQDAIELAWFIQERMSQKNEPHYRDTYAKNRYRTYVVNLDAPLPIRVEYQPIEIHGETITMHPDVYGRVRNWRAALEEALAAHGIPSATITEPRLKELLRELKKGSLHLAISDLTITPVASNGHPLQS